jgi:DNA-binding transcriptional LysR family regulator
MDLDPRRLLTLRAVDRFGGVIGAAESLHITPSAVSQQLAALERTTGITLFDRSGRTLRLTPAGQALRRAADQIDDALAVAAQELGARSTRLDGIVRIGSFQTAIVRLVAPAVERLRAQHPALQVEVIEVHDRDGISMLRSGAVDLVTAEHEDRSVKTPGSFGRGLGDVALLDDPFVVIAPTSWRIRSISQLATRPWVVNTSTQATFDALLRLATDRGFTATIAHRCYEFPPIIELVATGAGAAVIPLLALDLFGTDRVQTVSAHGLGGRTISVVHRARRHEPTNAQRTVIEALTAVV